MIPNRCLPWFVIALFKGMPGTWKSRHKLVFCWMILMQTIVPGRKTIKEMSRWSPIHISEWHFRRLLKSAYWSLHLLLYWFSWEAIKAFPPPENHIAYLIGDGSHKNKRGKKNPLVQKGRESKSKPFFFGIRFVLLCVCWDNIRIPVDFRLILPKTHPEYRKENALFREMLKNFRPPDWAQSVIVIGDAGYGCKDNIKAVQAKDKSGGGVCWFFVFAIARTWKRQDNRSIKNLVQHLPRQYYKRTWIPPLLNSGRRKTFWVYRTTLCLRHIGEVTVVLSKKGRNMGPKKIKILVTNLPSVKAREVVSLYSRRWSVEIIFKELKSGLGLGEHQVTVDPDRIEKSFGIAILAYLFLIRACRKEIRPGCPWGIFQLQEHFRLKVIKHQFEYRMNQEIQKFKKAA